ncbi:SdpA family antimicrobial peptide system protein [Flavobacterium sp. DG2-3]|uniref:SdpA family antimicrobial peptide system protein n=1 Tax=Flavobacterium sp. DG2-3 TaxID=3068317 RepID=UPI00273DBF15|nr:SdpA family antimicrobial peptide system protein [Flavobacterium sp. DG2-3]MDP5197983.1 SdpA family antimicrobial peptide system protein [Flavobacterium sp. DG2-3]
MSKLSFFSFFLAILIVLLIFFKITAIYFGNNPLNKQYTSKSQLTSMFPQGWAFFTKSSRESQLHIFDCNSLEPKLKNLKSFTSEYYFGISRKNRVLNIEMNTIFQKIVTDSVKPLYIKSTNIYSVNEEIKRKKIHYKKIILKKGSAPNFKGKYLFVSQIMLPWNIIKRKTDYPSSFIVYPIEITEK